MSLQVFLQAQLFGLEQFLGVHATHSDSSDLIGRCTWATLICEVLPRALLAELKLSRMLLGSSSAEQFLLVLAEEDIPRANEFLTQAAAAIAKLSADTLRLVWTSTENLGAWPVVRKRLDDALQARIAAPLSQFDLSQAFVPFEEVPSGNYFAELAAGVSQAKRVGWMADRPAQLVWDDGTHSWPLADQSKDEPVNPNEDSILFPRQTPSPEALPMLAGQAEGARKWGILHGDADQFDAQLRRANSIEEHIHLSVLFKEFFAGELSLLCASPEFGGKVTILYRGGDDFVVAGAWDALVLLARELHRVFEKFVEQNGPSFPAAEARTLSMSLSIAAENDVAPGSVLQEANAQLRAAKATDPGSFYLFGRSLEWKRLSDAEELKSGLVRLVRDFKVPAGFINDLASVYREAFSARATRRGRTVRVDKPWRTYLRLTRVLPETRGQHGRGKEFNNVRSAVITNLVGGKRTAGLKLRPSARVGLEWARLAAGAQ